MLRPTKLEKPFREKRIKNTDAHVGARVRLRRIQLGMSQTGLGDALGLSFQQIQKYEKGTNRIGASRLHEIATALRVAHSYFFENQFSDLWGEVDPSVATMFNDFLGSADGLRLMRSFVRIKSREMRRALSALVDLLGD